MYVYVQSTQLRGCGHDGYQRRHRDVDILSEVKFHLGYTETASGAAYADR